MEGSWDQLNLSEAEIDQYFEDADEQGYVREGEELEDIYEDDELSEMEGEELQKSLKLVMEGQMMDSIVLSSSGVQSRNTCRSIAIIHLKHSRQTFQLEKLLDQFNSAPYRSGNTR